MLRSIKFGKYLKFILIAGDFAAANLAWLLTIHFCQQPANLDSKLLWLLLNVAVAVSEYVVPYKQDVRFFYIDRVMTGIVKSTVIITCVFGALLYMLDVYEVGFEIFSIFVLREFGFLTIWRICSGFILRKVRRMGFNYRRVIIVGSGRTARLLYKELQNDLGSGFRVMGFFDSETLALTDLPAGFHGSITDIEPFVRTNDIDTIYYTAGADNHEQFQYIMGLADETGVRFVHVPKFNKMLAGQFLPDKLGSIPIMDHTFTPLTRGFNPMIKRVFDLMVAVPFLIVSPLIFIPIAIAIKSTSSGPVFFRQKRTGIYGSEFVCYKFRTMKVNADADKVQATENDPRKTKIGDFLRRSSLDELPQFFNVFLGNMSVVGPRPHMVNQTEEYKQIIDKYMIRHAVKPGITGWAQVNGYRGGTKKLWQMEKRVEYDTWYICNWNVFLDIKIIFLTVFNSLRGEKNAY